MSSIDTTKLINLVYRSSIVALLLIGTYYIGIYGYVAFSRCTYPFELEYLEGSIVDHIRWISAGNALYDKPLLEFIPYNYPPVYFYLGVFCSRFFGTGFLPLRLLSIVASFLCFGALFSLVWHETRNSVISFLAVSFFAATYKLTGTWLDLARIDSLFLCFLMWSIFVIKSSDSIRSAGIASVLVSLAFYTKQTTILIILPLLCYLGFIHWKRRWELVILLTILCGGGTILLNVIHRGWYAFYVFRLPFIHNTVNVDSTKYSSFWFHDVFQALPILCLFVFFFIYMNCKRCKEHKISWFYIAFLSGTILASWLLLPNPGAYINNLMPAYLGIAIVSALGYARLGSFITAYSPLRQRMIKTGVHLLLIIQLLLLLYDPHELIPSQADIKAGNYFLTQLAQIDGEVWVTDHGYLPSLVGKGTYAHKIPFDDVLRSGREDIKNDLIAECKQALLDKKFSAIIADPTWIPLPELLSDFYVEQRKLFDDDTVFWCRAGTRTRPERVLIPRVESGNR